MGQGPRKRLKQKTAVSERSGPVREAGTTITLQQIGSTQTMSTRTMVAVAGTSLSTTAELNGKRSRDLGHSQVTHLHTATDRKQSDMGKTVLLPEYKFQ